MNQEFLINKMQQIINQNFQDYVETKYLETKYCIPKSCFLNVLNYLKKSKSENEKYCLGYIEFRHLKGIPIEHCILKKEEEYFDLTVQNTGKFLSIFELESKEVFEFVKKHKTPLDLNFWLRNTKS